MISSPRDSLSVTEKLLKITQRKEARIRVLLANRGVQSGAGSGDGGADRIRNGNLTSENN